MIAATSEVSYEYGSKRFSFSGLEHCGLTDCVSLTLRFAQASQSATVQMILSINQSQQNIL